jgi:predicted amidohydrolase
LIVGGTWHEENDGKVANVATIFDGYGAIKLTYKKMLPFIDEEMKAESIELGKKLPVLVTDDQLVTVAICKDFCDLSLSLPYLELDVDLVLVPSMGNEATMKGHQNTAKRMRVLYGARTFIVQQVYPKEQTYEALGLVLPVPNDPAAAQPEELRQLGIWGSYHRD